MCSLWEKLSGCDLELRKYKSRISDSILQRMSGSGTQVYGGRESFTIPEGCLKLAVPTGPSSNLNRPLF